MEKGYDKLYTPTKSPKIYFILEESEVVEFQLSRLEKKLESMKEEFKKELDALKYDMHSIKEEILNEIRVLHTLKYSTQEEVKENKYVESQSLIGKVEAQLKTNKFDSLSYDLSLAQYPHFHVFNSTPRNYFIPKINTSKFDGNYPLTWIFQMGQFFETMMT